MHDVNQLLVHILKITSIITSDNQGLV